MAKLSIIVPIYNAEDHLRDCLNSLRSQTLKDIEVWLINDGSRDNSLDICNEYSTEDSRFHVYTQSNKGAGAARDKGIELSSGEYIGFVDSDDWVENDTFEKMYHSAIGYGVDIVRCNTILHKGGKKEERWNPPFCDQKLSNDIITKEIIPLLVAPKEERNYNHRLLRGCVCNIFRRELICDNNIHFSDLKSGEDVLFTIEAYLSAKSMLIMPNSFYHYMFYNSDSLSKSINSIGDKQRSELRMRMKQLLENTVCYEEIKQRWKQEDRRLIYLDIRIISVYASGKSLKERIHELEKLLNSSECRRAFEGRISKKLPFQMYVLYSLIKNKQSKVLYLLVRLKFRREIQK